MLAVQSVFRSDGLALSVVGGLFLSADLRAIEALTSSSVLFIPAPALVTQGLFPASVNTFSFNGAIILSEVPECL